MTCVTGEVPVYAQHAETLSLLFLRLFLSRQKSAAKTAQANQTENFSIRCTWTSALERAIEEPK